MLETIIMVLLILWLIGLITGQTFGGWIYSLLLIALIIMIIRFITIRKSS